MAEVHFTSHLRSWCPTVRLRQPAARSARRSRPVRRAPQVRGYVLDDQGRLRKHVCIFADGERLQHDAALGRPIGPQTKLYVMQALSGG